MAAHYYSEEQLVPKLFGGIEKYPFWVIKPVNGRPVAEFRGIETEESEAAFPQLKGGKGVSKYAPELLSTSKELFERELGDLPDGKYILVCYKYAKRSEVGLELPFIKGEPILNAILKLVMQA